jgi:hypothetical protein
MIPSKCIIAAGSILTATNKIVGEQKIISSKGSVLRENVHWKL